MNTRHLKAWVVTGSILSALLCAQSLAPQVVPDNTLPAGERSLVTGNPNFQIDGGARRGGNLFHSFGQFSVPTGGTAYFNNAADVQNIFSRVTGGSVSNIDGVIRANGTANLFLLNPNGILFGAGARLNIGGSFVASTANSINFADGFHYSATNPQTAPLLTLSVPIGLQVGANPGPIVVQGNGYNLSVPVPFFSPLTRGANSTGLQVPAGRTLALVGGDIELQGGTLTAEQGRIELGSVRDGQVSLGDNFALSYPGVQNFGNIRLSQQALADASGGGLIQVQGNQVSLGDGSLLLIQNQGTGAGGSIRVNAAQSLDLSGSSPDGRIFGGLLNQTLGVGSGADIAVSTRRLTIWDGAKIHTESYGPARSGNVTTQASDSVQVIGVSSFPRLLSSIATVAFSSGDAENVTVLTRELVVLKGGSIASPTFGTGHGGDVTVNALDLIKVTGQSNILGPSVLDAITAGAGDAGQVTINTSRLVIQDGGAVSTSTVGTGSAGSVTINARESVEVSGHPPVPSLPSFVGSSAPITSDSFRQAYGLPPVPTGFSGNVTINTQRLSVTDGARVEVSNEGVGNAGKLIINANSIFLDTRGAITAATASGEGGNIDLNVRDVLLLRNNSRITASAGGTGNGGNITIKTSSLVAVPNENSDIRANSAKSRGGNVTINASGIFGIQPRPQDTPLSDITATGANFAQRGTIQLNIERPDLASGLVKLPTTLVDPSGLIAQECPANEGNSFTIAGRGGLPPTPEQQLDDDAEWLDRRRLVVARHKTNTGRDGSSQHSDGRINTPHPTPHTQIIEATGWQMTPTGKVILIATTSLPTVHNPLHQLAACNRRQ